MEKELVEQNRLIGSQNIEKLYELMLFETLSKKARQHPNPLNNAGKFFGFSQTDEDSITLQILDRLRLKNGFFCEFGVGNGLENNTLILLAAGWSGAWFGGQELAFDISDSTKLSFEKIWITRENIYSLISSLRSKPNVISLDLDGNDIF